MEWSRMSKWWSKDWNDWIHFSSFLFFTCQNKLFQICLDVVHRKVWRESCACHKNYIRGSKRWLQRRMSMSWGGGIHITVKITVHTFIWILSFKWSGKVTALKWSRTTAVNECVGTKIPEDGEEEGPARIEVEAETLRQIQDVLRYYSMDISTQRSTMMFKFSGLVCFGLCHQIHSSQCGSNFGNPHPLLLVNTLRLYLQPLHLIKPMHLNRKATFILYVNLLSEAYGAFILYWTGHLKWNK